MNSVSRTKTLEKRLSLFVLRPDFDGFTNADLFVKRLIGKPWGQDIAVLSNMAEGYLNLSIGQERTDEFLECLDRIVELALHPKVNPYRKSLSDVRSLGYHWHYLGHLNTVLGCYSLAGGKDHSELHRRVSEHLSKISLEESNADARLIPHVKMRWAADQAPIINSLWLYDQATSESLHSKAADRWQDYMLKHASVFRDQFVAMHLLQRPGKPEEVAQAIYFLLSDDASYITEAALHVDGGFTAAHVPLASL